MGTSCNSHLVDKVDEYSKLSSSGEVTVSPYEGTNPPSCDYCDALAKWAVSYT